MCETRDHHGCFYERFSRASRTRCIGQKLQCDEASEFEIFSFVGHTHAATTEFLNDAIVRDRPANHLSEAVGKSNLI
jgi:hypothetical protein